jgi:glycine cleavage system aminomethyltransferase T
MLALRTAAAVTRLSHVRALRVSGAGAPDVVDALTTSRVFIRENQMMNTLILDAEARPWADLFVCQDEDSLILLAEGPTGAELGASVERLRDEKFPQSELRITNLEEEHVLFGLDGPFAWEIASAVLGPEVLGAPYLSFLTLKDVLCFRAGKTGEYGYTLLVPKRMAADLWEQLQAVGTPQGLVEGSLEALDQCALENWHFSMRALSGCDVARRLTPIELQLQWRLDYERDFVGAAALRARRPSPLGRLTSLVAPDELRPGQSVRLDGADVGTVLWAGWSSLRKQWVAWALLQLPWAWPGLHFEGRVESRSAPLLNNRSLYIDPHRHNHETRTTDAFPPLVVS